MSTSPSVARKQEFSKLDELADEWGPYGRRVHREVRPR
jgi:hypothetical protein